MTFARRLELWFAAGLLAAAVIVPQITGASAQGLFDFLFGGFGHYRHAPRPPGWGYGYGRPEERPLPPREERSAPRERVYCVRLCDGSYFPIEGQADAKPGELCQALCPASKTAVFQGSEIAQAAAPDGRRYSQLENAFRYRQRLVPQCTCNGEDHLGLAAIRIENDPTLRPGDMVATQRGLMAFTGTNSRNGQAHNFTPVEQYAGLPRDVRRRLANITVKRGN
jgi:Protein of unknown function (DUF2865)